VALLLLRPRLASATDVAQAQPARRLPDMRDPARPRSPARAGDGNGSATSATPSWTQHGPASRTSANANLAPSRREREEGSFGDAGTVHQTSRLSPQPSSPRRYAPAASTATAKRLAQTNEPDILLTSQVLGYQKKPSLILARATAENPPCAFVDHCWPADRLRIRRRQRRNERVARTAPGATKTAVLARSARIEDSIIRQRAAQRTPRMRRRQHAVKARPGPSRSRSENGRLAANRQSTPVARPPAVCDDSLPPPTRQAPARDGELGPHGSRDIRERSGWRGSPHPAEVATRRRPGRRGRSNGAARGTDVPAPARRRGCPRCCGSG